MNLSAATLPVMEIHRRKDARCSTAGLLSSLTDGKSRCLGTVDDVSEEGIRLGHVPLFINDARQLYVSVIHGPEQDFAVLLRPRWQKAEQKGMYRTIGCTVDLPTAEWKRFVHERLSPADVYRPEVENDT